MMGYDLVHLAMDASTDAAASGAATMAGDGGFFSIFKVIIALYLLYTSILGKGKIFENNFLKCSKAKYRLIIRLTAGAAALFVMANAALEFFYGTEGEYATLITVLWALGFATMLAMLVLSIVLVDRKAMEAARKEQEEQMRAKHVDPLRAAFVFDEEDEESEKPSEEKSNHD